MKNILLMSSLIAIFLSANYVLAGEPDEYASSVQLRNKIATQRFYDEVVNKHNLKMIDSLVHPDYAEHQTDPHYSSNRKGLKKEFEDYFTAFPDMQVKTNLMIAEGDMIVAQFTMSGTNSGPIYHRAATNKKFEIKGVDIIRYKDGKGIEHWGFLEEGKLLTQLGLMPLVK